jgi:hypothetical protein
MMDKVQKPNNPESIQRDIYLNSILSLSYHLGLGLPSDFFLSVGFEVLRAVIMKCAMFQVVTPCRSIEVRQIYRTTRRHNPVDHNIIPFRSCVYFFVVCLMTLSIAQTTRHQTIESSGSNELEEMSRGLEEQRKT